jgi:hypothetical protein
LEGQFQLWLISIGLLALSLVCCIVFGIGLSARLGTSETVQIINAEDTVKTADWIKQCCMEVVNEVLDSTGASVSGFVMDSASANRSAMANLDADPSVGPLVNLPCVSHTLSLLLKDLSKQLEWVKDVYDIAVKISACCSNSDIVKHLLKTSLTDKGVHRATRCLFNDDEL